LHTTSVPLPPICRHKSRFLRQLSCRFSTTCGGNPCDKSWCASDQLSSLRRHFHAKLKTSYTDHSTHGVSDESAGVTIRVRPAWCTLPSNAQAVRTFSSTARATVLLLRDGWHRRRAKFALPNHNLVLNVS
jgi:hypothetical protein